MAAFTWRHGGEMFGADERLAVQVDQSVEGLSEKMVCHFQRDVVLLPETGGAGI